MNWMLLTIILASQISNSNAESLVLESSMLSGNAIISASALQRVAKQVIVSQLQKNIDANNSLHGITINSNSTEHSLTIPESPMLNDILSALGIKNNVQVALSPIETSIDFSPQSLKLKIIKKEEKTFKILVHWEIAQLRARAHALKIKVPKGAFDQEFTISSSPIKIALNPTSGPLTADFSFIVQVTDQGNKFGLGGFKTNLDAQTNKLQLKLGKLSVNGEPLELEVITNGKSIKTDELTVRKEFQRFEPQLMKIIEGKLSEKIHSEFKALSGKLDTLEPLKVSFNTSEILEGYTLNTDVVRTVLKNITGDFMLSSFQEIPNQNLFSTQIASNICIGNSCLVSSVNSNRITSIDTAMMGTDEAGMILYESWLKNIINSDEFQSRVHSYYHQSIRSPGVEINSNGVKIHFNPLKNSIAAVLNLRIDIKATVSAKHAYDSWGSWVDFMKKQAADIWENMAGSGEYVYIPVEINFIIKPVSLNQNGKRQLQIVTEFPFQSNGSITNTFGYYTNLSSMNATIRDELLQSVKSEISSSIPKTMSVSLEKPIDLNGTSFYVNRVLITKNKGLLVSGDVE